MSRADWSRLTAWLSSRDQPHVTIAWTALNDLVGGLPASATNHYPQWWHGDRPNTRAWRAAGYELAHVDLRRSVSFRRHAAAGTGRAPAQPASDPAVRVFPNLDPLSCLIILQCSASKAGGGNVPVAAVPSPWPGVLQAARGHIAADARLDRQRVLPAWQRYTGTFYVSAHAALAEAVAAEANIVILSGGYGVLTATEPIGTYKMVLRLGNWPRGVLEQALLERARQTRPTGVVAFVSATTDYARLIRRTPWQQVGLPAYLVTARVSDGGAMVKVPRALANAFTVFWRQAPSHLSEDVVLEQLT